MNLIGRSTLNLFFFTHCVVQGRITEFKKDQPGHSLSVACYLHKKCSVVRLISKLPFGACARCIAYLEAGLQIKDRDDASKHKAMNLDRLFGRPNFWSSIYWQLNFSTKQCLNVMFRYSLFCIYYIFIWYYFIFCWFITYDLLFQFIQGTMHSYARIQRISEPFAIWMYGSDQWLCDFYILHMLRMLVISTVYENNDW